MVIASIRPSTVDGIKQLAKKIRRERSISHTEAMDVASQQAGYGNFVHARRTLAGANVPPVFSVYLSMHWRVYRSELSKLAHDALPAGRELLRVDLSRPLPEIVPKHRVRYAQGLMGFRVEYVDHLEHLTNEAHQQVARSRLLKAARALHFMDATGLHPVTTQVIRDRMQTLHDAPGRDHVSEWFDPLTGDYLALDEPYDASFHSATEKRTVWQKNNGIYEVAPDWEGIYYPGMCSPLLVGHNPAFLERMSEKLAAVKPVAEPERWPHDTGKCGDDFVSPARQADAKTRRPRPGPSWLDHKGARPYGGRPGERSRWRPAKPMALSMHKDLGTLMRGLITGFSLRVSRKLSHFRSELENWSLAEHADAYGDDAYDLYYGGGNPHIFTTDGERRDALVRARAIVEGGYEDCKPRRELLEALDLGIAEMSEKTAS